MNNAPKKLNRGLVWFVLAALLCFFWTSGQAREKEKLHKFSLSFTGGLSSFNNGDLNLMAREATALASNTAVTLYFPEADWKEMKKTLPHFGLEFLYHPGQRFAVGLGFQYESRTNSTHNPGDGRFSYKHSDVIYNYQDTYITNRYVVTNGFSADLIRDTAFALKGYYFLPLGKNFQAFINAGPVLHLARLHLNYSSSKDDTVYTYRYEPTGNPGEYWMILENTEETVSTDDRWNEAKSSFLGFEAGIGLEVRIAAHFHGFIEGDFKVAKSENWKGKMVRTSGTAEEIISETITGKFFYQPWHYLGNTPLNYVAVPLDATSEGRKASIDFGGPVFRAGFRIVF